jgi:hypothetical protein
MYASTPEAPLTFANFNVVFADPADIYKIGATEESRWRGVLPEMAEAFGHTLATEPNEANLLELKKTVGQAKTLQDNIPGVQKHLGRDANAVARAQDWVTRTGFLEPVSRSYIHPDIGLPEDRNYMAMMTDGTANWMDWRAEMLVSLAERMDYAAPTILVAGNDLMCVAENPRKVGKDMTRADYMRDHVQTYLGRRGIVAMVVAPQTDVGDRVMDAGTLALKKVGHSGAVVMASNGGAWSMNVGQMRRALMRADAPNYLFAVTEERVKLGDGTQPASTHQNPFSALGQIVRNHLELYLNI